MVCANAMVRLAFESLAHRIKSIGFSTKSAVPGQKYAKQFKLCHCWVEELFSPAMLFFELAGLRLEEERFISSVKLAPKRGRSCHSLLLESHSDSDVSEGEGRSPGVLIFCANLPCTCISV